MKKTAIILAAGMGKRLGDETNALPKALVKVGDKTLLAHTVDLIRELDFDRIIVVGGFMFESVEKEINDLPGDIEIYENKFFEHQNLLSLEKGIREVRSGAVFVTNIDYIIGSSVVKVFKSNLYDKLIVFGSRDEKAFIEDGMKMKLCDGRLVSISKDLSDFDLAYTGHLFVGQYFLSDFRNVIKELLKNGDTMKLVTESAINGLIDQNFSINVCDVGEADWVEIDTFEELEYARARYASNKENYSRKKKESLEKCLLCRSENIKEYYRGIDNYFSKKEVVFSACLTCSLIFQNPRPSAEEYEKMYAEVFQDQRRGLDNYEKAVERVKSKGYDHKKREAAYFQGFIKERGNYLDIGGAWGTLAKAVEILYPVSIQIVEPSELAAQVAREYHGFAVHTGDFDSFLSMRVDKKYDFVSLSHVLEHMLDPLDFLVKLRDVLDDDGYVYIAVPDVSRPFDASDKFFHIEHTIYFSTKTLRQILQKSGFEIVRTWTNENDLKIICRKSSFEQNINFSADDLPAVKRAIFFVDTKYKILRATKKMVSFILPKRYIYKLTIIAARALQKLGIIRN